MSVANETQADERAVALRVLRELAEVRSTDDGVRLRAAEALLAATAEEQPRSGGVYRLPDSREGWLLDLVQTRGADGEPLLTTAHFWELWPDQSLRPAAP